ncbi:abortive phage infection protein [Leptolyngbya sp. 'hensonii']|uniref:CPBP family intramembrane glutamic endopeptidase n=1 Tax=Leptolyngbya sp. 'hensonii' TaxID=1922337 RepID=UPI00094F9616|nr:type II CAAX endopeptidase family protein [Leptolyngbya sp. 'hensonii']OLP15713.1 abortive phage infection protein [Leptolyngbya sp. 'hensonii']
MQVFNLVISFIGQLLTETPALAGVSVFFILWLALWLPIGIPLAAFLSWHPGKPLTVQQKLPLLASLYLVIPLVFWVVTKAQSIPFSAYGLAWDRGTLTSLSWGLAVSLLSLIVLFSLEKLLGWMQWQPQETGRLISVALPMFFLAMWVGGTEELIFRGFLQTHLQQGYAAGVAAAIGSLIFAFSHMLWEGRAAVPQLPGLWLMGMVLVLARWVDAGNLGLAWGLHAGWVWGIVTLDTAALITYPPQAPAWLTGLDQKPLAGFLGLLLMVGTGVGLWVWRSALP